MVSSEAKYLKGLNEAQKQAVLHTNGPLLIVAGAGAGKTKTITHRIAHLMETGTPAHNLLAVTFTNKAAGEMRDRIRNLAPHGKGLPVVATFHSLGVRLLREFHQEAGVPRGFSIWDRDDSVKALKAILERIGAGDLSPRATLAAISRQKGAGVTGGQFVETAQGVRQQTIARAWDLYDRTLREEGALDFDDLLLKTLALLEKSHLRALLHGRWTHFTIDEYQDTNKVQYEIARLLAQKHQNICVVGDLDQAIYTWRGASIENLLDFEKAFPHTKVITLEQNYRSTRTILSAANAIIEKNTRRRPKHLFTENPTGDAIDFYGAQNEIDEAWFVALAAQRLLKSGISAREIAVLYRENFQSRAIEEALLSLHIPYRVLGTRFFERKEVKDVLSYIRAALNPKSRIDLRRIVATPPRGIGKVTLEKMIFGEHRGLPKAATHKVSMFRELLAVIKRAIETLPASEVVRFAFESSGIEALLKKDTEDPSTGLGAGGKERIDNVHELVNLATRYDHVSPPEGVERLLEEAALQSEQDELEDPLDAVTLMTVHASKGLEFDVVFVTGLEQGLFPSMREGDGPPAERDPEEERRLFYVALTRARKRILLSCAGQRMKYGSREYTLPSEFLDDIDPRLMQLADPSALKPSEGIIE